MAAQEAAEPHVGNDELTALRRQVRELGDRAAITEVCDRYVNRLDSDRHNDTWFDSVFTEDVHLTFPFGEYKGFDGLAGFQQMARTTFERTHHLAANHRVELYPDGDEDRARVRAHLMAIHVRKREEPDAHFDIGGHYDAEFVRTPVGWRIRRFTFDLVWHAGQPPNADH
ncbi:nuclear transport factor 2 family protein [Streptomyces alkaliterrae]|uniref:Nuclear transport factor 2 family protein n=1 Tax=Streptomyces alkaliterrae TaxID=2213162 RepID=A0A5P0YNX1_9ACTN|nr:nuclear transport factor 2 family protein [Streptomyces alkaliterrae]MBB1254592.1 nuclear transport factor 2 family protein [Streptomyces alkaliterrae]MBB1257836.1 nuclear transport factor 2 family protein [Streptomyces alkaliterrae]MQS01122.1 nuclear transport factor 2 family protein [Streptomyces alkaliterrae]